MPRWDGDSNEPGVTGACPPQKERKGRERERGEREWSMSKREENPRSGAAQA